MIVKKEELLKALTTVKPGLGKNMIIDQVNHFAFLGDKVMTYNDEISLVCPLPEGVVLEGSVLADEFSAYLSKTKAAEIDIEVVGNEIQVTAGKSKAGFAFQEEINLPIIDFDREDWQIIPENLCEQMTKAASVCGNDPMKPKLMSVCVTDDGYVLSADGFRAFVGKLTGEPVEQTFQIPGTLVKDIVKINPIEMCIDEHWAMFRNDEGTMISSRVYFETFPDVGSVFPSESELTQITLPDNIDEILEKASIFNKQTEKIQEYIQVTLGDNKIKLRSESIGSWFEEEANCRYKDEPVQFGVAQMLLKDVLKESKVCGLSKHNSILFSGEDWKYLAMLRFI